MCAMPGLVRPIIGETLIVAGNTVPDGCRTVLFSPLKRSLFRQKLSEEISEIAF
jgi:hypothetical protein